MTFDEWAEKIQPRLKHYIAVVSSKIDASLDYAAQYINTSNALSNIRAEVEFDLNEAEAYYQDWLAVKSQELNETDKFKTKNLKTILDYAKNINCPERRIVKLLQSILHTIDFRGSQIQSKLKYFKE